MAGIGVENSFDTHTADGVTTIFSYTFFADDPLSVKVYSLLDGVKTPIYTGFSISQNADYVGGSVTFSTAPAAAVGKILIRREVPYTQLTEFTALIRYKETEIERALNKLVMQIQQVSSLVSRALKYDESTATTDITIAEPEDGKALVYDGTSGRLIPSSDYISDAIADAVAGVTGAALVTATSTTALAVAGTGSKTWTTQANKGFAAGQRLRVASDDGTKVNEGIVTSYVGTSLTINVDYASGSSTHADWNISIAGDRGASGSGSGDMVAAQNLADVADKPTAFATIKQAATDTSTGVVELATSAEAITGTDTARAVTPKALQDKLDNYGVTPITTRAIINQVGVQSLTFGANVASISDQGTGITRITFTTPYADTDYNVQCSAVQKSGSYYLHAGVYHDGTTLKKTTTYVDVCAFYGTSDFIDADYLDVVIIG